MARARRLLRVAGVVVLIGLVGVFALMRGHGARIRVDTGDLRYDVFGLPYRSVPTPATAREKLLPVAEGLPEISGQWVSCGRFPPWREDFSRRYQRYYEMAVAWMAVDPQITALIVEDLAGNARARGCRGKPDCVAMLTARGVLEEDPAGYELIPGWRRIGAVRWYLKQRGYALPQQ